MRKENLNYPLEVRFFESIKQSPAMKNWFDPFDYSKRYLLALWESVYFKDDHIWKKDTMISSIDKASHIVVWETFWK